MNNRRFLSTLFFVASLSLATLCSFTATALAQQVDVQEIKPNAPADIPTVVHGFNVGVQKKSPRPLPNGDWFRLPGALGTEVFTDYFSTIPQTEIGNFFNVSTFLQHPIRRAIPYNKITGRLFDDLSVIRLAGRQGQHDKIRIQTRPCDKRSRWDEDFFLGVGVDTAMNKLTKFVINPVTNVRYDLVTFYFDGQLLRVEKHRADVHIHRHNRFADGEQFDNSQQIVEFTETFGQGKSAGGLWTLSYKSAELMECTISGWEFESGGWTGEIYLVPHASVEMRKELPGDRFPVNDGPEGLLGEVQGGFPTGAFCENTCDQPTCPTPKPLDMGMKCEALIKKFPASYWAHRNTELPKGGVQIPDYSNDMVNTGTFTALIQSKIAEGLSANATPVQKFNAGWLSFQLNLLANGSSTKSNLDWSKLMCLGVKSGLPANVEVNGQAYTIESVSSMFSFFDLSLQIGRGASTNTESLLTFAYIFNQINGG